MSVAFYCVADDRYFLGAVGLVNSLRLVGHGEPIHLLDCGLTEAQRELLRGEVELIDAPAEAPPTMLKTIAPLSGPADAMVLIDTDMIATRPLTELIERAASGKVIAFENDTDRFVAGWADALGLGPLTRHRYVSFGFLAVDRATGTDVLRRLAELQDRVDFDRTYWRTQRVSDYEFLYADQDVLNAILAASVEPDGLLALDQRLAPLPPFDGVRIADERTLRCANADGSEPYVLHHWLVKPWLEPTHDGVYSRLLRRLLTGDDVAVRVPDEMVPRRLRTGPLASAERLRINARERLRQRSSA